MDTRVNQRIAPNRVALIGVLLLAAWLVFEFYPRPAKSVPPVAPVVTESKLNTVDLADNPDWAGLPEFFAVWADKLEWDDEKTLFAYWHPGSKTYAYYFEAIRHGGSYRFRVLTGEELTKALRYSFDEAENDITAETLNQQKEPTTHPFVFVSDFLMKVTPSRRHIDHSEDRPPALPAKAPPRIGVDISPVPMDFPKPVVQSPEIHDGKKR